LWRYLRRRQRLGYKFRRQHVIDRFVVDFYCAEAQLVVEPDGEVHDFTGDRDVARQDFLEQLDLRVLRFANDDVMTNLGGVITSIERALRGTEASLHGEESGNLT
jgi:very-short-patch-repair endonuclease